MHPDRLITSLLTFFVMFALPSCSPPDDRPGGNRDRISFKVIGNVMDIKLNEISGIETTDDGHFIVHNDDGGPTLWILAASGHVLRKLKVRGAKNRDWEDLTRFTYQDKSLLAIGDIGDNPGLRPEIRIYFVESPEAKDKQNLELVHTLKLSYPDGPRDSEALAYDPASEQLLFLTKRDKPPRLYSVDIDQAMTQSQVQLDFLGTVSTLRLPAREDSEQFGKDSFTISQPTGMDISADGKLAAVITYRSLYLFNRHEDQTWLEAFQKPPREFYGPRSRSEEAIAFTSDMKSLVISAEGRGAPIFRVSVPEPETRTD